MAVFHFFLVNSTLIYILFSLFLNKQLKYKMSDLLFRSWMSTVKNISVLVRLRRVCLSTLCTVHVISSWIYVTSTAAVTRTVEGMGRSEGGGLYLYRMLLRGMGSESSPKTTIFKSLYLQSLKFQT